MNNNRGEKKIYIYISELDERLILNTIFGYINQIHEESFAISLPWGMGLVGHLYLEVQDCWSVSAQLPQQGDLAEHFQ